jgi:hypothetical protein
MELAQWNASQAAKELGFSAATVTRLLALLALPNSIVEQVQAGRIPASAAYELARIEDPARQAELAGQLAQGQLTRDGLSPHFSRGGLKKGCLVWHKLFCTRQLWPTAQRQPYGNRV